MIWQNPWAWAGLVALGIPILIHLLARRRAKVQPFPTLRFLAATKPLATRRSRLSDLLLLAVRLGVLTAAVAALAQPLLLTGERSARMAGTLSRVVIVDTTASMRRPATAPMGGPGPERAGAAEGDRALDIARQEADAAAREAAPGVVVEAASLGEALEGAAAWLEPRGGLREIVVISDFQRNAVEQGAMERAAASLPQGIGLDPRRIETTAPANADIWIVPHGESETSIRIGLTPDATATEWIRASVEDPAAHGLLLLDGEGSDHAAATWRAAVQSEAVPAVPASRPIAVLFPGHAAWEELVAAARPLDQPWMGDAAAALHGDPALARAAAAVVLGSEAPPSPSPPFVSLARTRDGQPIAFAARVPVEGVDHFLLVMRAPAGSLASAALLAGAARAVSLLPPVDEMETATLSDAELAGLAREAAPARRARSAGTAARRDAGSDREIGPARGDGWSLGSGPGESDGRWLWLLALGLLGIEVLLRRRARQGAASTGQDPSLALRDVHGHG